MVAYCLTKLENKTAIELCLKTGDKIIEWINPSSTDVRKFFGLSGLTTSGVVTVRIQGYYYVYGQVRTL